MPYLPNFLDLFTPEAGLTAEGIARALEQTRKNPDKRELQGLREELGALYREAGTDWVRLLDNEEVRVYTAENQGDARDFVTRNIWNLLFPENENNPPEPL